MVDVVPITTQSLLSSKTACLRLSYRAFRPAARPQYPSCRARLHDGVVAASQRHRHMVISAAAGSEVDAIEVEMKVQGMTCSHCSDRVQNALMESKDVKGADVSVENGSAKIQVEAPSLFDAWNRLQELVATVTELGFEAEPHLPASEEEA